MRCHALYIHRDLSEDLLSTPNLANLVSSLDPGERRQPSQEAVSESQALWGGPRT